MNNNNKFLSYNELYDQIKSYGFNGIKDCFLFILNPEKRLTCTSLVDGFITVNYEFETQQQHQQKSTDEQIAFSFGYYCLNDLHIALRNESVTVTNADALFTAIHIIINKARNDIQLRKIIMYILKVVNPDLFNRHYVYQVWTDIEKNKLLDEISQNVSMEMIAINHYRSVQDIKNKMRHIAYELFVNTKLSIEEIMKITTVSKDTMNNIVFLYDCQRPQNLTL
jgi:hypothetical protein